MSQASFSFQSMPPVYNHSNSAHHADPFMGSPFNTYEAGESLFSANDFFYTPSVHGKASMGKPSTSFQHQHQHSVSAAAPAQPANSALMSQLMTLMQEPQTAQMLQQLLLQQQLNNNNNNSSNNNKPPSPKLLPLIQQSHLEQARSSSPDHYGMDSKSSGSSGEEEDYPLRSSPSKSSSRMQTGYAASVHGGLYSNAVASNSAYANSNSNASMVDHDDMSDEVVTFVPGVWKNCTFNHSQLLREFAVIPRKLIKKLVSMSEKENWGNNNEILLSYLNYTFRRLIDEKKIAAYFADNSASSPSSLSSSPNKIVAAPTPALKNNVVAPTSGVHLNPIQEKTASAPTALCFNTGLLTTGYERIFCFLAPNKNQREIFQQNSHKKFVDWFVTLFVKESDILKYEGNIIRSKLGVNPIPAEFLPQRTSYFSEKDKTVAKEIVWNGHTALDTVSYSDMIKNMRQNDHLSFMIQSIKDEELSVALKAGLSLALKRAECNPRIAVPQYYWDKNATIGELQLLLPLDLDTLGIKCAATVRIGPSGKYEIRTVLSLNQAYTNARLIQKIDQSWLMKAF